MDGQQNSQKTEEERLDIKHFKITRNEFGPRHCIKLTFSVRVIEILDKIIGIRKGGYTSGFIEHCVMLGLLIIGKSIHSKSGQQLLSLVAKNFIASTNDKSTMVYNMEVILNEFSKQAEKQNNPDKQ